MKFYLLQIHDRKKRQEMRKSFFLNGSPGEERTPGLQIRSPSQLANCGLFYLTKTNSVKELCRRAKLAGVGLHRPESDGLEHKTSTERFLFPFQKKSLISTSRASAILAKTRIVGDFLQRRIAER